MEKDKTSRITNFANVLLDALEMVAQKNATVLCKGFMYEPEIPKNLDDEKIKRRRTNYVKEN